MNIDMKKPVPVTQPWSEKFWEGTREGKLLIQTCNDCGSRIFYPRKYCPECWSGNLGWIEASGKAKIETFSTAYTGVEPKFMDELPYTIAYVDLTEGVINIIRAFNYTFDQTGQIVGEVTYAANKSTQSLDDILTALSYAGKPAQAANTSFEQLAAALSVAANQGIRGSKAGVALRFAFTSLMRPTQQTLDILKKYNIQVYDSEQRMKPLPDLLAEIEKGVSGLTEKRRNEALATIVGVRATSTWLALLSAGSQSVRDWTENISNAGNEAEIVAKDQLKALLEKWGQIKKGIQAVVYALVDQFSPGLKGVTDKLIELTTKTENWVKANKDQVREMVNNIAHLGLLAGKIGLVLILLPKILNFSISIFSALTNPFILAAGAIYALSIIYRDKFKEMYDYVKEFWDKTNKLSETKGGMQVGPGTQPGGGLQGLIKGWLAFDPFNTMPNNVFKQPKPTTKWQGLKTHLPESLGEKMKRTAKSDFEFIEKKAIELLPILEKIATKVTAAFGIDLPKDLMGKYEELQNILKDLIAAYEKGMEDAAAATDKTTEATKELAKTFGNAFDPTGDWKKFLDAWDDAKKTITASLLTIQETAEGVVMGMNDAFKSEFREWIGGTESFAGAFQNILNRMKNMFLDFIAEITMNSLMAKIGFGQENAMTWGRGIAAWNQGGGFSGIWNSLFPAPTSGPGTGYPSGYTGPLSKAIPSDFSGGGRMAKPAITFNITNEIPGAELAVVSAETQADRTVLNATMRLASSNTMFRRTFVNPGGR